MRYATLLRAFLVGFCISGTVMARAEYSVKSDVTRFIPPMGLVIGTDPTDLASATELDDVSSANTISCSSYISRTGHIPLPPPPMAGPLAAAEMFCHVSWEYIGGGPPGGVFESHVLASVGLDEGTSVAKRDGTTGKPTNVFEALAIASTPRIKFNTAGHTARWYDGKSDAADIDLLQASSADLYVRTTATVGPDRMTLFAYARVKWVMSWNDDILPPPLGD